MMFDNLARLDNLTKDPIAVYNLYGRNLDNLDNLDKILILWDVF